MNKPEMDPRIQKNSEMLAIELGKLTMQNIELQVACEALQAENVRLKDELDSKNNESNDKDKK
ncbi:hypothetical protein [Enterococcus sp. AZ196]|uniref:hypothetical protein n=1 Tax=Enterococcus sp. AZ196 TaxID=2774659 RepID=UPI003D29F00F